MDKHISELEKQVSRKIKEVRRARGWTLSEFEVRSSGAIKAVVLGSYERGSRSINFNKLEVIAKTFDVPITYLLGSANDRSQNIGQLMIDIRRVRDVKTNGPIERFFGLIANKRGDWNGEILTLRSSDIDNLALIVECDNQALYLYLRKNKYLLEAQSKS
jgi:transcriptional regulator with XRE-family HTH domain